MLAAKETQPVGAALERCRCFLKSVDHLARSRNRRENRRAARQRPHESFLILFPRDRNTCPV